MPSFDPDTNPSEDRAYQLANSSMVSLFWKNTLLDDTLTWLAEHGYLIHRLNAALWATQADFHRDIKTALDFPDYYGHNLNAFNDCLHDVASYAYGASRDATGTILVFTAYDAFAAGEPRAAQIILDIIADAARHAMLIGHRLLCLVQSNDPHISFDAVGRMPVSWNLAERMDADRWT